MMISNLLFRMLLSLLVLLALCPGVATSQGDAAFEGSWELVPAKSSEISLYRGLRIDFGSPGAETTLIQTWGNRRSFSDTLGLRVGSGVQRFRITNRVFATNVFMGLSMPVGGERRIRANWADGGNVLRLDEEFEVLGSQGSSPVRCVHQYTLSPDKEQLTYTVSRSTRTSGPDVKYVLKRAGTKVAYFMKLQHNWEISGLLPTQAMLISLQGVVNVNGPMLYFIYPPEWPFTYTESVFEFYQDRRNYTFRELRTPVQALRELKQHVKGYVVWDRSVRTSLIVAFTVAGLERAVVVTEDLIPMVEDLGLKAIEDLRGKFTGQTDAEIYSWAYERYWDECNKEFIVWLGGPHGNVMRPGVADWGVYKQVFFNDLSSRPSDTLEYALAKKILSEMKPMSMVMGWHSYAKDLEREHLKLTSSFGHRVEGLHTLPNLSFSSQVPPSPGFVFKNNHTVQPGKEYTAEKKVYISCVQTDGIGIGAWLKPGRGEIPYAWEVLMNYTWMAPAMAEYFYTMATPNDYFIGCLSGPGYLYPKAVPPALLPKLVAKARGQMELLDLNVFEIMDYSEGATVEGNTELTKEVVDVYYEGMPDAIGFLNGYAPAYTFTERDGKPLVSYDYYLSPTRPEEDAVADLQELAAINANRPYFLLLHVRESSDVKRVKGILDNLGADFELIPLDLFLTMAGKEPTFEERFLKR
jgi:hypothetical protein